MQVDKIMPCGYCKGVLLALNIAQKTRIQHPDTEICILGELVHNSHVTKALEKQNIRSLKDNKPRMELLDEIDNGIVIFSAHGVADCVYEKARNKGLTIVDATCPDVLKTKKIIQDYLNQNYEIFYIGVKNHPEAEGVISNSSHIHLIGNKEDLISLPSYENVLITNQTTMNIKEITQLISFIKEKYPSAIEWEEICPATRMRQEAVIAAKDYDILYVVGDPKSNNTKNLASIADSSIKKVRRIESVYDIEPGELKDNLKIAVTAGASTPTALYQQVIDYLKDYCENKPFPDPVEIL